MKPNSAAVLAALKKHATTKTITAIAQLLGVSRNFVVAVGQKTGFKKPHVFPEHRERQAATRKLIEAHAKTHSLTMMGRMLGVSRERVRQICEALKIRRNKKPFSKLHWMSNDELRQLVTQPTKSLNTMAKEAGVTPETLRLELRRRGLKTFTRLDRNRKLLRKGKRLCNRCRRIKPLKTFARANASTSGYGYRCLECSKIVTREWTARQTRGNRVRAKR